MQYLVRACSVTNLSYFKKTGKIEGKRQEVA
jgi:hypothetical protein